MPDPAAFDPGPAAGARVEKDGETWTLVLVRDLAHPPERVWRAITEPEHLRQWAPFDADASLGTTGAAVRLTTVGTPGPQVSETRVIRAEAPKLLAYAWGGNAMRWELEPRAGGGTRLTLWATIDRRYIALGAAGWHLCLGIMDRRLAGDPLGRIVGPEAMRHPGWQRLHAEYARQFGVASPSWPS